MKYTVEALLDDFDNEVPAAEHFEFEFEGVRYEIDLSAENAEQFRETMDVYIEVSRKVGGKKRAAQSVKSIPARKLTREENAKIREWAAANGIDVASRGRINSEVVATYNARKR